MRVAFLSHYSSLYGANRSLVDLIRGLQEYDIDACVMAPANGELAEVLAALNVQTFEAHLPWWVSSHRSVASAALVLGSNAKVLVRLASQIRAWKADVVYSNSSFILAGLTASKFLGLPHVWHLREFIDLDWGLEPDLGWKVFSLLLSRSDAIITVSDAVRRHLLLGRDAERTHVIHSGVVWRAEFDRLREEADARKSDSRPYTFAMVGLLSPTKGQDIAIQALAQVSRKMPDVRLVIAGSGSDVYQERCRALVQTLGVEDSISFRGYVGDPFRVYLGADAVLMCSRYEAQGRVTLEAMAASRPVIAHGRGGTPEIVEHERTGLLYAGGPEGLASCMLRLAENPQWARQLGARGWEIAREKYSIEACARQVYGVLQGLV